MANTSDDLDLPAPLAEVARIGFEWEWDEEAGEDVGCDFELYDRFEAPDRTAWWFRLWTGNPEVDGAEFRFFGTTGCGDYTGFWLVRPGAPVTAQPVVHVGSEGERGVLARDLGDLLWLFAAGLGPAEAFDGAASPAKPNAAFRAIAERHAPGRDRSPARITADAQAEFPHFSEYLGAMCR